MSSNPTNQNLFEVFGRSPDVVVPEINREAAAELEDLVREGRSGTGRLILLRSPRAGYGKTHLLQSLKNRLGEDVRFLAAEPTCGGRLDGGVVLESVLRQLTGILPASGGLTELDFFARRLLAHGLRPLLISGEIPSHDREGAIYALENRPVETFDFHHQQAATAHWTQSNFEVLGPRLAAELSEACGNSLRDCAYWVELLFHFATTPPERVERTRQLTEAVFADLEGHGRGMVEERLQALLGLLGLVRPVVIVFDETEGLSNQPEDGLRVAAFLVQLRQACPALTVILSVNRDVWESGFEPLMPGGLRDRLTEYPVELGDLSREGANALVKGRFGPDAETILSKLDLGGVLSARQIVRSATREQRALAKERGDDWSAQSPATPATPPALPLAEVEEEPAMALPEEDVVEDDFVAPAMDEEEEVFTAEGNEAAPGIFSTKPGETREEPAEDFAGQSPFKAVPDNPFQSAPPLEEPEVEFPRKMAAPEEHQPPRRTEIIDVEPELEPEITEFVPENLPDPFGLREGGKAPGLEEIEDPVSPFSAAGFVGQGARKVIPEEAPVQLPWQLPGDVMKKAEPEAPSNEGIFSVADSQPGAPPAPPVQAPESSPFKVADSGSVGVPAFGPVSSRPAPIPDQEPAPNPFDRAPETEPPVQTPATAPAQSPEAAKAPATWQQTINESWEKPAPPKESPAPAPAGPFSAVASPFEPVKVPEETAPEAAEPEAKPAMAEPTTDVAEPMAAENEPEYPSSPFAAHPISSATPANLDDESAKVEDLLNQFKRRFGGE